MRSTLTPRQKKTLELLESKPAGYTRNELARAQDLSVDYVGDTLGELRQLGLAVTRKAAGGNSFWFAIEAEKAAA